MSQEEIRREIAKNQETLKTQLADLYLKINSGDLSVEEKAKLDEAIRAIKKELEPKTRAVCKQFGIPTDSEVMRMGRGR
jgi:hypothetical protein